MRPATWGVALCLCVEFGDLWNSANCTDDGATPGVAAYGVWRRETGWRTLHGRLLENVSNADSGGTPVQCLWPALPSRRRQRRGHSEIHAARHEGSAADRPWR